MAREDLHFRLRIPEDLKKKVEESAAKSERSMTAEIISRLEDSYAEPGRLEQLFSAYADLGDEVKELRGTVKYLEEVRRKLEEKVEKSESLSAAKLPEDRTLYVLLDADGLPVSWQEIYLYLGEVGRAGKFTIDSIEARIFNADMTSSNDREEEYFKLFQRFKKLRRSARGEDV